MTAQLNRTGSQVRALYADIIPGHSPQPTQAADWKWIIEAFVHEASTADRAEFERLIFATTELHHRGTDVLNPDRVPQPIPSDFVRRMPGNQAEIEANRDQRLGRHVYAYHQHIRRCLEHYILAWTALIDGCLICDWAIIDDEFPKLGELVDEARRAFTIWSEFD